MNKERIEWMDAFRGIGMCCVIMGHMQIPKVLAQAIFSFHMPLFFFASGYLYSGRHGTAYVLKKVDSLIIPYLVYGVLGLAVRELGVGDVNWWFVKMLLCGNGVGVVWFLSCLFMADLIGSLVVTHIKQVPLVACAAIAMAGVGYWMENNGHFPILMSRVVFQACVFWIVGYLFRTGMVFDKLWLVMEPRKTRNTRKFLCIQCIPWLKLLVFAILVAGCALFRLQRVDFGSMKTGNPVLLYATAMAFIILIAFMSRRFLGKVRILKFMGRNSLLFMNWHVIIPTLSLYAIGLLGVDANSSFALKCIQRVANIALLFGCVWWLSRHANVLSGRGRFFSRFVMKSRKDSPSKLLTGK